MDGAGRLAASPTAAHSLFMKPSLSSYCTYTHTDTHIWAKVWIHSNWSSTLNWRHDTAAGTIGRRFYDRYASGTNHIRVSNAPVRAAKRADVVYLLLACFLNGWTLWTHRRAAKSGTAASCHVFFLYDGGEVRQKKKELRIVELFAAKCGERKTAANKYTELYVSINVFNNGR